MASRRAVPDRFVAVDAGCEIVYALTDEPWGVRRFPVRAPGGAIANILQHRTAQ